MKIDYMSRGLCVRLLLLLVIGLGLPVLAVNVAHAQDQAGSTDARYCSRQAPADKQAAQTDTSAMAEGSAAGGDFEFDPWAEQDRRRQDQQRQVVPQPEHVTDRGGQRGQHPLLQRQLTETPRLGQHEQVVPSRASLNRSVWLTVQAITVAPTVTATIRAARRSRSSEADRRRT